MKQALRVKLSLAEKIVDHCGYLVNRKFLLPVKQFLKAKALTSQKLKTEK